MPLRPSNREKLHKFFEDHAGDPEEVVNHATEVFSKWARSTIEAEFEDFRRDSNTEIDATSARPRFLTLKEWISTQNRLAALEEQVRGLSVIAQLSKDKGHSKQQLRFLPEFVQYDEGQLTFPFKVYFGDELLENPSVSIVRDHGTQARIQAGRKLIEVNSLGQFDISVSHLDHTLEKPVKVLPIDPDKITFVPLQHTNDRVEQRLKSHTQTAIWRIECQSGQQKAFPSEAYYRSGKQSITVPESLSANGDHFSVVLLVARNETHQAVLQIENVSYLLSTAQLTIPQGHKDSLIPKLVVFSRKVDTILVVGPPVIGIGSIE